jgi:hypothetical protein
VLICRPCFCIAALFAVSSFAWADNIVLDNSTFSTLPAGGLTYNTAGNSYTEGAIPGWNETGAGLFGQLQPASGVFNYLPSQTIAFSTGGTIWQDAGVVQAGETYTLSVDIGTRTDMPSNAGIDLSVNGVAYVGVGAPASPGNWSTFTATYTALSSDVGAQIYIQLIGYGWQGDFADVQLTDDGDPAPEPSTFALLLAGAGAVYLGARRRRSNMSFTPERLSEQR